jgi:hypothetical protein
MKRRIRITKISNEPDQVSLMIGLEEKANSEDGVEDEKREAVL